MLPILTFANFVAKGVSLYNTADTLDKINMQKKALNTDEQINSVAQYAFLLANGADLAFQVGATIIGAQVGTLCSTICHLRSGASIGAGILDVTQTITSKRADGTEWEGSDYAKVFGVGAKRVGYFGLTKAQINPNILESDNWVSNLAKFPIEESNVVSTYNYGRILKERISSFFYPPKPSLTPTHPAVSREVKTFFIKTIQDHFNFVTEWKEMETFPDWFERNEIANNLLVHRCSLTRKLIRKVSIPDISDDQSFVCYEKITLEQWIEVNGKGHNIPRWKEILCCKKVKRFYPKGWPKDKLKKLNHKVCEKRQNAIDETLQKIAEKFENLIYQWIEKANIQRHEIPNVAEYLNPTCALNRL